MIPQQPLVSVIIPCYNAEKFVEKAVESIINQSYKNLEIILIDDASTDKTKVILDSFSDSRISRFYFSKNTRKIGAVNEVLPQSKGALITFQDADDWSASNRIELQVNEFLKNKSLGVCFTGYCVFDENSNLIFKPVNLRLSDQELKNEFLNFGNNTAGNKDYTTCATMMVHKAILDKIKGYNTYFYGRSGEDIYLVYNILKFHESITINLPLYNVVRTIGSFTDEQSKGINIKSAYVWKVLSYLIAFDQKGINLLEEGNRTLLLEQELASCEEALREALSTSDIYKNSTSYKLGNTIVKFLAFMKRNR